MKIHMERELDQLKRKMLSLGTRVEEQVRMAIHAFETRDGELAEKVVHEDEAIDQAEVEVEEDCLKIIALHQPVAVDLRFLTATIKINSDLERAGDEAVNIAERVMSIARKAPVPVPFEYGAMAEKSESMLKSSLDSLVNMDADLAYKVCLMDDEVDDIKRDIYDKIKEVIREHPDRVGYLINLLLISRHLERIADHATNIAEEVIYMVEGEITRHRSDLLKGE